MTLTTTDRRTPAPAPLVVVTVVIAALFAMPGGYIVWRAIGLGADFGEREWPRWTV